MNLNQKILDDLKNGMKSKNALLVSVLRMLIASLKNEKIDKGHELSEEEVLKIVQKEVKIRHQSITEFEKAQRDDLVQKQKAELEILAHYLPEALSEKEIATMVSEAISKLNVSTMKDMGKVIGFVMSQAQGKADGTLVSKIVKDSLTA